MKPSVEKFMLWDTTDVRRLSGSTVLVRNNNSGQLLVKKTMDVSLLSLHQQLMALDCEQLVRIFDVCEIDGQCVVIEEYIQGKTVEEIVATDCIHPETAAGYMIELCKGLQVLHAHGIIHRDIKPANIMIPFAGNLKIIDFDISRFSSGDAPHDTTILGTAGFAAPEQFGFTQTDNKSDIYAAGVLFGFMMTGQLPDRRAITGPYAKIIQKCTMIAPEERYHSVQALQRDIHMTTRQNHSPFRRMLHAVPGFRAGSNPIIAFCAVYFYLMALLAQVAFIKLWWPVDKLEMLKILGRFQFLFTLPFLFYTDFLDGSLHIPVLKTKSKKTRRMVFAMIGTVCLVIGLLFLGYLNVPE